MSEQRQQLMANIDRWYDEEAHQEIVDAILAYPKEERDDEILGQLAVAYNNTEEYEKALAVLDEIEERCENLGSWHYRRGYALFYLDRDEQAKQAFLRCQELEPSRKADCQYFLNWYERREKAAQATTELYTEEEMAVVEAHISTHLGEYPNVFHELASSDIHVDTCIIPPTEEHNYYTLVTLARGARSMTIQEEQREYKEDRGERCI